MRKRPSGQSGQAKIGLAEQIRQAFADVPYPGDTQIVPDPLAWEADEIAAAFKGQHWRTISVDLLGQQAESLFHFTPEAYRFFLPAYLLAEVAKGPPEKTSVWSHRIGPALEWSLLPPRRDRAGTAAFHKRMDPLTRDQKAAIRAFLHWKNRKGRDTSFHPSKTGPLTDVERALRDYWADAE